MRSLFLLIAISICCVSFKRDRPKRGEAVEIYLLKSYQLIAGKCQIDPRSSVLQDTAIIKNEDILAYSQRSCQFRLTDRAIQKVKALQDHDAFAVIVGRQPVYYGFFKPPYSSASCSHSITMDLDRRSGNRISMRLGYPELLKSAAIDDQRNSLKLIAALKYQGKLR